MVGCDLTTHSLPDLNLSMSVRTPWTSVKEEPNSYAKKLQLLRQHTEQIRLAAVEKAFIERTRELTRRELDLAKKEFARAKLVWEQAREEVEKAERLKEIATRRVPYEVLAAPASNFSREVKLGGGGFGSVYRGQLDGRDVAIKKVSLESEQGITEYISEVTIISRLRHCNLVELVGWCHHHEREQYLLVYEFMPHGSLDRHLYDPGEYMPWSRRLHVALGLAAALRYLHHECKPSVVHRDVKPSNVMLDAEFNAKLGGCMNGG